MAGPASVLFTAFAVWTSNRVQKIGWYIFAVVCFVFASYRMWKTERESRQGDYEDLQRTHLEELDRLRDTQLREVGELKARIEVLQRKPYRQDLEDRTLLLLGQMNTNGKRILREILRRERIEVGRHMLVEIPAEQQAAQVALAFGRGIIQYDEVRSGTGAIIRTDMFINPQYRPVLEDALYREETQR
jgi:hypothetical protein